MESHDEIHFPTVLQITVTFCCKNKSQKGGIFLFLTVLSTSWSFIHIKQKSFLWRTFVYFGVMIQLCNLTTSVSPSFIYRNICGGLGCALPPQVSYYQDQLALVRVSCTWCGPSLGLANHWFLHRALLIALLEGIQLSRALAPAQAIPQPLTPPCINAVTCSKQPAQTPCE